MDPLLRVEGLRVRYGAVTALDGVDLTISAGEMFVLLGGSGSGKTTLLRALAGFVKPEAGRIVLDGQDLAALPPYKRPVNTMFQSYALFPHMSVADNVAFGLRQLGMNRADITARVAEMLDLVALSGFARRRPHKLSGGQQQRVALARSLAPRPKLLLLDEPLSALDRNLREQTRSELLRVQRQLGITFILVTHDQEEALTMATRIGLMRDGSLAQTGTPEEVYERPASRFVAEFLGAANILTATVRDGGALDVPGVPAPLHIAMPSPASGTVLVAIRPERLHITPGPAAPAANTAPGVVTETAYWGETTMYTVRLPNGTLLRATRAMADGAAAARIEPGAPVTLSWRPDACILLPS